MMRFAHRFGPVLLVLTRVMVGGIFLLAGIDKVQAVGAFADAVRSFHMLPPSLVLPFAHIVPWLEILVGVYLVAGFQTRIGAAGAALLLLAFTGAIANALITGNTNHPCGCFGPNEQGNQIIALLAGGKTVTPWDVIRDLIMIGLAASIAVFGPGLLAMDSWLRARTRVSAETGTRPKGSQNSGARPIGRSKRRA
jgi:uncharacterized membrane protein YphA (DoxX/SURF4 family)